MEKKKLTELLDALGNVRRSIQTVQRDFGYRGENDITGITFSEGDPEELFLLDELNRVMNKLDEAVGDINYLSRPIEETDRLVMSPAGRLGFPRSRFELTCGRGLEVLVDDGFYDGPRWMCGRIEHDGERYYFTGCKDMELVGALARRRKAG
ncbi:MAG: DUF5348 domain-containing protein [Oscillibacter sp.]|nr:DUF5348 domain-containing protein [Oscillibacter sp.]